MTQVAVPLASPVSVRRLGGAPGPDRRVDGARTRVTGREPARHGTGAVAGSSSPVSRADDVFAPLHDSDLDPVPDSTT